MSTLFPKERKIFSVAFYCLKRQLYPRPILSPFPFLYLTKERGRDKTSAFKALYFPVFSRADKKLFIAAHSARTEAELLSSCTPAPQ